MQFVIKDGPQSPALEKLIRDYGPFPQLRINRPPMNPREVMARLVMEAWPGVVSVDQMTCEISNMADFRDTVTIELDTVEVLGLGYRTLSFRARSGKRCDIAYLAGIEMLDRTPFRPIFETADMDWLAVKIPERCAWLDAAFKQFFTRDFEIKTIHFTDRHGMPSAYQWSAQEPLGKVNGKYYTLLRNLDDTGGGQHPLRVIVESNDLLPVPVSFCGKPLAAVFSGGHIPPLTSPPARQFGPVQIAPAAPAHPFATALVPTQVSTKPPSQFTAYDVLKFLERELDVKTGMISGGNFLLHRVTIYDRENWEEKLRGELPILKSRLGDKIGVLGDMKIVGLDEPYQIANGQVLQGPPTTEAATGKFAVHMAYKATYQAQKITILALVKA